MLYLPSFYTDFFSHTLTYLAVWYLGSGLCFVCLLLHFTLSEVLPHWFLFTPFPLMLWLNTDMETEARKESFTYSASSTAKRCSNTRRVKRLTVSLSLCNQDSARYVPLFYILTKTKSNSYCAFQEHLWQPPKSISCTEAPYHWSLWSRFPSATHCPNLLLYI